MGQESGKRLERSGSPFSLILCARQGMVGWFAYGRTFGVGNNPRRLLSLLCF